MAKLLNVKNVGISVKEGYNNFMYVDSDKRNQKLKERKEEILAELEAQKEVKLQKKAEKKALKEERRNAFSEKLTSKKEGFKSALSRFKFQPMGEDSIEVVDEDEVIFFGEDEEQYSCQMIEISQLLDEKFAPYEKAPKGADLLKRNLTTSKLYISDNGDIMKVNAIKEVAPENPSDNEAFLLFDTNREYYVIKFTCKKIF